MKGRFGFCIFYQPNTHFLNHHCSFLLLNNYYFFFFLKFPGQRFLPTISNYESIDEAFAYLARSMHKPLIIPEKERMTLAESLEKELGNKVNCHHFSYQYFRRFLDDITQFLNSTEFNSYNVTWTVESKFFTVFYLCDDVSRPPCFTIYLIQFWKYIFSRFFVYWLIILFDILVILTKLNSGLINI